MDANSTNFDPNTPQGGEPAPAPEPIVLGGTAEQTESQVDWMGEVFSSPRWEDTVAGPWSDDEP